MSTDAAASERRADLALQSIGSLERQLVNMRMAGPKKDMIQIGLCTSNSFRARFGAQALLSGALTRPTHAEHGALYPGQSHAVIMSLVHVLKSPSAQSADSRTTKPRFGGWSRQAAYVLSLSKEKD